MLVYSNNRPCRNLISALNFPQRTPFHHRKEQPRTQRTLVGCLPPDSMYRIAGFCVSAPSSCLVKSLSQLRRPGGDQLFDVDGRTDLSFLLRGASLSQHLRFLIPTRRAVARFYQLTLRSLIPTRARTRIHTSWIPQSVLQSWFLRDAVIETCSRPRSDSSSPGGRTGQGLVRHCSRFISIVGLGRRGSSHLRSRD
jgi:hypothetical protein